MKRNVDIKLLEWKQDTQRKPLIVRGARQIGKSWSINELGKSFKKGIVTINLEQRPDWHGVFNLNYDVGRILNELEILTNQTIKPTENLLFFDEIQECPKAIIALRYFYEQMPELHVISAGSLLEFTLRDIPFPVGRVQLLDMYPMTFAEYLEATSQFIMADYIKEIHPAMSPLV